MSVEFDVNAWLNAVAALSPTQSPAPILKSTAVGVFHMLEQQNKHTTYLKRFTLGHVHDESKSIMSTVATWIPCL